VIRLVGMAIELGVMVAAALAAFAATGIALAYIGAQVLLAVF
jgi:hypothetical protein